MRLVQSGVDDQEIYVPMRALTRNSKKNTVHRTRIPKTGGRHDDLVKSRALGLSAKPGDAHVLDYLTPVGAGLAIGRDLKSGRIQSDLRKTGADIKKVGADIDRHASGVKNDVKKTTASVGKKIDGAFKSLFE